MQNIHKPVLLEKILDFASDLKNKKVFDGTFGGGGYTGSFLAKKSKVWASDKDREAIKFGLIKFAEQVKNQNLYLTQSSFSKSIQTFDDDFFDLIVLDLGFSSNQLEYGNRGFSYQKNLEILDLRYDPEVGKPCYKLLFELKSPEDLARILYNYSGESLSSFLSKPLFELLQTKKKDILTVGDVTQCLKGAIPPKFSRKTKAILSRIWQALRIFTNDEFIELEIFLNFAIKKLAIDGLLLVISFHSLEDKIVTKFMRNRAKPRLLDDFGNQARDFQILTPKPISPDHQEISLNIRSRSAVLRVLQKLQ